MIKHKKNIIHEQVVLNRIADTAILLQSMGAVLSRSDTAAQQGDLSQLALANGWCAESHHRIAGLLAELGSGEISKTDQLVLDIGKASLDAGSYLASSPVA